MTIRCKKCLKKYPSHYPQCPHCGKINPNDQIKTKKGFNPLNIMPQKQCRVCGTPKKFMTQYCVHCSSCFEENTIHQSDISHYEKETVDGYISNLFKKDTVVDFEALRSFTGDNKFELGHWRFSGNEKYGRCSNVKLTMLVTSLITCLPFLSGMGGNNGSVVFLWCIIVLGFTNYIVYLTRHKNFSEWLLFESIFRQKQGKISLNVPSRGEHEKYSITDDDIDKVIVATNPETYTIEQIRFVAKEGTAINSPVYIVDTTDYYNMDNFKLFIVLFCNKYNIKLITTHTVNPTADDKPTHSDHQSINRPNKLFVRLDHKVQDTHVSQEDYDAHIEYLSILSNSHYLKGGGFPNEAGGMIIFDSKDLEEARSISDHDPIIKKGYFRYELKEWQIMLDSEK